MTLDGKKPWQFRLRHVFVYVTLIAVALSLRQIAQLRGEKAAAVRLHRRTGFYWEASHDSLGRVTSLRITHPQRYDAFAAPSIAEFSFFEELDLRGCAIGDFSVQQFARLSRLRRLDIRGSRVSQAAVDEFARLHPDCEVLR